MIFYSLSIYKRLTLFLGISVCNHFKHPRLASLKIFNLNFFANSIYLLGKATPSILQGLMRYATIGWVAFEIQTAKKLG